MNVAQMDVFSRLMIDRIIFLGVQINDDVANIIIAQLLFPAAVDPKADKGKGSPRARLLPGARTMACRLTKKSFERSSNCRPGPRHTNWDATKTIRSNYRTRMFIKLFFLDVQKKLLSLQSP